MANTIRIPVPDVAYARVSLPKIDIGDNPYEALEGAIGGIAGALDERKAIDDAALIGRADAALRKVAATHVHERMQAGDDGLNLIASTNGVLDEQLKYWKSQTKDKKVQAAIERAHARIGFDATVANMHREAAARAGGALRTAGATMDELTAIAFARPHDIGAVRDEVAYLREQLPEAEAVLAAGERRINEAYLRGLIRTNRKLALETLQSRKGAAEQDLGIGEPAREALEAEAERALQREQGEATALREREQIALRLDTKALLANGGVPLEAYLRLRDALKVDPPTARRLEADVDAAQAATVARAKQHVAVGQSLVEGRTVEWDTHSLTSLGTLIEAVANDGSGESVADRRRIRMALIAGTTPPQLQGHIREGLASTNPTRRAAGIRMVQALNRAGERNLTSWLPPDLRTVAHRFEALGEAGYADADALKRLDASKGVTAEKEAIRRNHFDAHVRIDALTDAAAHAFGIDRAGIAEAGVQSMRSPNGDAEFQTAAFPALLGIVGRERLGKAAQSAGYSVAADILVTLLANANKPPHEQKLPSWESLLMSAVSGAASGVVELAPGEPWKWEAGIAVLGSLAEDALANKDFNYWAAIGAGVGAGLWQKWGKEKFKAFFGEKPISQAAGKSVSKAIKEIFGAEVELASEELGEFMRGFARAVESDGRDILDYWQKQFDDWFWSGDEDPFI